MHFAELNLNGLFKLRMLLIIKTGSSIEYIIEVYDTDNLNFVKQRINGFHASQNNDIQFKKGDKILDMTLPLKEITLKDRDVIYAEIINAPKGSRS